MRNDLNNRGFIKAFISLVILGVMVFAGISFGTPIYRYFFLSARTSDILKSEVGNVQYVREKVMEQVRELKVPIEDEDLVVTYDAAYKRMQVTAKWSETVDLFGLYQHKMNFDMKEEL